MPEPAPEPAAASNEEEQSHARFRLPVRLRTGEAARLISGVAVAAALTIVGATGTGEAPSQADPLTPNGDNTPALTEARYKPITDFEFKKDDEEAIRVANEDAGSGLGSVFDVVKPSEESRRFYRSYFNLPVVESPPKLTEVIHIQDHNIFSGEVSQHPHIYPFDIYNTTQDPIDITYLDYALRAERYWLNENKSKGNMLLDNAGFIDVRPRLVPHDMVMLQGLRNYELAGGSAHSYGVTIYAPGELTKSFVLKAGGRHDPFRAIATEMCQSMIAVHSTSATPWNAFAEKNLERTVSGFNPTAKPDNIRWLADQESVCNMLGRAVSTAYRGGKPALERLQSSQPETQSFATPWLDYGLVLPEFPKFLWLAHHVPQEWNTIITGRHDHTPTDDYYRQHHRLPNI